MKSVWCEFQFEWSHKKKKQRKSARAHTKNHFDCFQCVSFFQILIVYAAFSDRSMIIYFCTHFNTISVKNDYLNTYSLLHDCHYSSKSMSSIYNFRWFIRVLLLFCILALFEISESFQIHIQIAVQKKSFPQDFKLIFTQPKLDMINMKVLHLRWQMP